MFEQVPRLLKVVTLIIFIGVLVFVLLIQRGYVGKRASTIISPISTNSTNSSRGEEGKDSSAPAIFKEAAEQASKIQDQVTAGTLSPEEAQKQLNEIGSKLPNPPIPPEIQKQIDEVKSKQ